jgi:methionyl-tRNA synthetase
VPTRQLITSALPYINGIKHLGNLIGSMLPADVYARYLRQRGDEVLFICATDEHGTPAELAAAAAGEPVDTFCEKMHHTQADLYRRFALSFDHFGRTSAPANHRLTQTIYTQLRDHGFIEKRQTQQMYSPTDGRFLPDRYIVGTCPKCAYVAARGDQCENCSSVLEPVDLIDARSAISGSADLEVRTTAHLFLKLSALQPEVAAWVEQHKHRWSDLTASIAQKWLTEGLHDRCITRDLRWGVPVPETDPELAGKVFYVWFDAPIGYMAATCQWADAGGAERAWEPWWRSEGAPPEGPKTEWTQFMAKDNVPFHAIMFPAMLLGTRDSWRQPDQIKGFNWLNYYGEKFSTSARRGIFLDQALDLFPADVWRWGLLSIAPESKDGTFTWEEFAQKVNKDLNDNLGNFVNRTLKFCVGRFGSEVPEGGSPGAAEAALQQSCAIQAKRVSELLAGLEFRKASDALRDYWTLGNLYIDQAAPWKTFKEDPLQSALAIRTCINLMHHYVTLCEPFIPATSAGLAAALNTELDPAVWQGEGTLTHLGPGHAFSLPEPLFSKVDAATVAELTERFSGATTEAPHA